MEEDAFSLAESDPELQPLCPPEPTEKPKKKVKKEDKGGSVGARLADRGVGQGGALLPSARFYLRRFGWFNLSLVLALFLLNQSFITGSSAWLTVWSEDRIEVSSSREL